MNKILSLTSALGLAALMTACDPYADLCYETHPNQGTLYLAWDFPGSTKANSADIANDTMTVLAVRKTNMIKYIGKQARPASGVWTQYIHRLYPEAEANVNENGVLAWDQNKMHEGTYDVLSFNSNGGNQFTVDYSDFLDSNVDYFRSLRFSINTFTQATAASNPALLEFRDVTSRAAYASTEFLAPYTNDMYWAMQGNVKISTNKRTDCKFTNLQRITQNVTITLNINKTDADMFISGVRGVLSGVPSAINVVTGEVDCANTFSAVFNGKCDDKFAATKAKATVTLPVVGLLPGEAGDDIMSGRAKLHLCFSTLTHDATGALVAGAPVWAAIDLTSALNAKPSVKLTGEGKGKQTGKDFSLAVGKTLRLGLAGVGAPTDDTDWKDITK